MILIKIRKELKSGIVELSILALLLAKDMYGYEISSQLDKSSSNQLEVKEGTLYPILYRLEEKNVVESYWKEAEGRGKPRKYYKITQSGKEYYEEYRKEWKVISHMMDDILK